jgi:4'-phosphopantetheinyl transferase
LSTYADVDPADWKFRAARHGKPNISAPKKFGSLRFNLTHTRGLVICLVSRSREVGVDAEEISRKVDVDQVARHFFSKREQAALAVLPAPRRKRRFFEFWTLKEAYLKARGRGLWSDPAQLTIELGKSSRPAPRGKYQLSLRRVGPRHIAAAAVCSESPIPIKWRDARRLFKAGIAIK